jgi:hypothetical protein
LIVARRAMIAEIHNATAQFSWNGVQSQNDLNAALSLIGSRYVAALKTTVPTSLRVNYAAFAELATNGNGTLQ